MKAVNKERMLAEFKEVVAVPCHTLQERPVFELLRVKLEALGFIVEEDDAGEKLGGNCGNLWAFLPGNKVGATVHFVDEGTDTGAIIMQKPVMVEKGDTPEILQRRVMEQAEWKILPWAIDMIANQK